MTSDPLWTTPLVFQLMATKRGVALSYSYFCNCSGIWKCIWAKSWNLPITNSLFRTALATDVESRGLLSSSSFSRPFYCGVRERVGRCRKSRPVIPLLQRQHCTADCLPLSLSLSRLMELNEVFWRRSDKIAGLWMNDTLFPGKVRQPLCGMYLIEVLWCNLFKNKLFNEMKI